MAEKPVPSAFYRDAQPGTYPLRENIPTRRSNLGPVLGLAVVFSIPVLCTILSIIIDYLQH